MALLALALPAGAQELKPFTPESLAQITASRAGKPFVLAFWSLTCAHCQQELADFGRRPPAPRGGPRLVRRAAAQLFFRRRRFAPCRDRPVGGDAGGTLAGGQPPVTGGERGLSLERRWRSEERRVGKEG